MKETDKKDIRIKECILQNLKEPFEKIDRQKMNVSKSVCKLIIRTKSEMIKGTGFFLKIPLDLEEFYCLLSNEHVIKQDIINTNNNIYISYDNEYEINLKLDPSKRYIKSFIDEGLDITVIEILEEDKISKDHFLYNELLIDDNKLINSQIYIPQYAKGKELVNARGKIIKINKYEFTHLANTEYGSSGSPIFLINSERVIGIHKESNRDQTKNYGDFIYPVIDIIKNDIKMKRNMGKYINGKYIYEDGKYYLGEFKNNLPNGKGVKYYSNGNIQYEGHFRNGKYEGKGKFILEDGSYYIGQFKNGLRNGKGIKYYSNGNIMLEGDWIDGEIKGNGKFIWEDGSYYIGQFKNGLRNGKGTTYYSNGNIQYEGDWIDGKMNGNGKFIWKSGSYYIGQWKNGLMNGKGTIYYSNGNIMFEGDWIDGKINGNGKFIFEDGSYYIGQFKNGLRNGKGTTYYSNGNIQYEGDWIDGKMNGKGAWYYSNGNIMFEGDWIDCLPNGNGKFIWKNGVYYIGQFKNGLPNGKGAMYYSNGNIKHKGNWDNGSPVDRSKNDLGDKLK
jgi:hypothetical protein